MSARRHSLAALGLASVLTCLVVVGAVPVSAQAAELEQVPNASGDAAGARLSARAFEVRYRALSDAADLIGAVLSDAGSLTLKPRLNIVVVEDRADVLTRVEALLKSFDLPPQTVEVTLSLFLGRREHDGDGATSDRRGELSTEVRGMVESLGNFTKWTQYELLGSRSMSGVEGEAVVANVAGDYRVDFIVDSVHEAQGRTLVKFEHFTLEREVLLGDGGRDVEELYTAGMVVQAHKLTLVVAASAPDSQRALFLALQVEPEVAGMPEFIARVATGAGDVFERSYVAEDEGRLRRNLENQDLMILDVKRKSALLGRFRSDKRRGAVSIREFLLFNKEFAALIHAGLPIISSLDILLERRKNQAFKQALLDIRDRVRSGEALSDAFAAQGEMFPSLYPSSLASGERSGELSTVLNRYIDYMQKVLEIRAKVISSLIYPAVLLVLSSGLIGLMVFFIIPKFNDFLTGFDVELPLITRVIMGVANFCQGHWQAILGVTVLLVMAVVAWQRTEKGKFALDVIKLKLPLVGGVMDNYAQNRFTRTLSTLVAGGIPLVNSIELSARAVGNRVHERALLETANQVREGRALFECLAETEMMSDITVQMVKVGESTGALEEMLNHASDFTDHEIDTTLTRLVALIEPLMLVFMAIVVAVMLMAIYLPMINLYGSANM